VYIAGLAEFAMQRRPVTAIRHLLAAAILPEFLVELGILRSVGTA